MNLKATFGRYELGSDEKDAQRIEHMKKLTEKRRDVDVFRDLIDKDIERKNEINSQTDMSKKLTEAEPYTHE